ncbi:cyanophycinase [Aequorivita antarctica]|uniref:Cyanophycinase n=1 Tax=Aequorivita antarctica TaxID=153266 RepID=A0A5C6Z188_9FLAO|nr:cyanophycinase [Aequorivita antarctica]TXD73834.1 cyanophycinase [Aequorivita antarctica]SRX73451.1 Cyanophycinase [Aequorivita antarctica]
MKLLKHYIPLALIGFAALQFSAFAQQSGGNGKLVIIGGGSRPEAMVQRIIKEAQLDKSGYGIILPMSSAEPDSAVYYAKKQFVEAGLTNIVGLQIYKDENVSKSKLDSIKNANMIYISGGDQNRFMDIVGGTTVEEAIHEAFHKGSLVAGTSAGAAVMSKMMITGNELKHSDYSSTFRNIEAENIEIKSGLGMVTGVIIDQHFVKRSRYNRLISAIIEHPDLMGIGIDESTAILVKGYTAEVLGDAQVIVLKNPTKSKNEHDGKLGARNLKLDIYLPGETFTIN